jgi:hypothetical protein
MKELAISPDFTLEDIRKIRDYNYEMTKDMTPEKRSAYYKKLSVGAMTWYEELLAGLEVSCNVAADPQATYYTTARQHTAATA